jgi:hypothetical protein
MFGKPKQAKEVLFYRNLHIIRDANDKIIFEGTYKAKIDGAMCDVASINAAKRESRKLQAEHGQGCLRVVK